MTASPAEQRPPVGSVWVPRAGSRAFPREVRRHFSDSIESVVVGKHRLDSVYWTWGKWRHWVADNGATQRMDAGA